MKCNYGCGKDAQWTLKNGKRCCSKRPAGCEVLKKVNSERNKETYRNGRLPYVQKGIPWNKGKSLTVNDDIFTKNSKYSNEFVKGRIVKDDLLEYVCGKCNIDSWLGETLVLELDHVNGINNDHRLENLRLLCPNCHSQTDTYRGRNKNKGVAKVTDDELLTTYQTGLTIRQTLMKLGLAPKGGNYERIKKLIARMSELVDESGLKPDDR